MQLNINGTKYTVEFDDNDVASDIASHAPIELALMRFDGHEYYSDLSFRPRGNAPQTSHLLPGHIYYWGAGNAFVINFRDYDIAPYKSTQIGRITDMAAVDMLENASRNISGVLGHD